MCEGGVDRYQMEGGGVSTSRLLDYIGGGRSKDSRGFLEHGIFTLLPLCKCET